MVIEGQVDGNNILDVYHTVRRLAEDIWKTPRPVPFECITFRMRGYATAKYAH